MSEQQKANITGWVIAIAGLIISVMFLFIIISAVGDLEEGHILGDSDSAEFLYTNS